MRLSKSLLCGISALALATGAAFAGGSQWQSTDLESDEALSLERDWTSEPESLALSEQFSEPMNDRDALAYIGESPSMSESELG